MSTKDVLSSTTDTISSSVGPTEPIIVDHICKIILYYEIPNTKIRLWDVFILTPNFMFLLFLIYRFRRALLKLRATSSLIYLTFYCLVVLNVIIGILRCLVSMIVNASSMMGGSVDIILWVIVRFFLLMTEMSVVIFGLAFGHLDSRSSIRHVLVVTSLISLAYSICQGVLEVLVHDPNYHVTSRGILLFGHGGNWFFFVSSITFTFLYFFIIVLPWTRLREKFALPVKKSFYIYIALLILLNLSCSIGGGLLIFDIAEGLCVVDIATGIYFMFFTPIVYHTFLSDVFETSQSNIQFSYKSQADETVEDDNVSLPHQQSFSSMKTDSDYIYQTNSVYESTHFNAVPINPLYVASLQSPDSITGYSLDSQIIDIPTSSKPSN